MISIQVKKQAKAACWAIRPMWAAICPEGGVYFVFLWLTFVIYTHLLIFGADLRNNFVFESTVEAKVVGTTACWFKN